MNKKNNKNNNRKTTNEYCKAQKVTQNIYARDKAIKYVMLCFPLDSLRPRYHPEKCGGSGFDMKNLAFLTVMAKGDFLLERRRSFVLHGVFLQ